MLVGASPRRVAIVGGCASVRARQNGAYLKWANQEMLTATLAADGDRLWTRAASSGTSRRRP